MEPMFRCTQCGYVHEGQDAPDVCPKCGAPKEMFKRLDDEAAEKIYASDITNDIHMEIITHAAAIMDLCDEGIELALDPPCVGVFEKTMNAAWIMKKRSKAEIAGHVGKGKW